MNAAPDRTALIRQEEAERAKRMGRAVADIMDASDEERSLRAVSLSRGVPEDALREELHARGWVAPNRIRQRRSRAKQLPPAPSDNQS